MEQILQRSKPKLRYGLKPSDIETQFGKYDGSVKIRCYRFDNDEIWEIIVEFIKVFEEITETRVQLTKDQFFKRGAYTYACGLEFLLCLMDLKSQTNAGITLVVSVWAGQEVSVYKLKRVIATVLGFEFEAL